MPEMKVVREFLKMKHDNLNEFIAAMLLDEIESVQEKDVPENVIEQLLEVGLNVYYEFDYSTPIGVGVALSEWVNYSYEEDKDYSETDLFPEIESIYFGLEKWR